MKAAGPLERQPQRSPDLKYGRTRRRLPHRSLACLPILCFFPLTKTIKSDIIFESLELEMW